MSLSLSMVYLESIILSYEIKGIVRDRRVHGRFYV
jgi:hypothetical protein